MPDDNPEDYRPGSGQATNPQDGAGQQQRPPVEEQPTLSLFTVSEDSLLTKTNQYGGTQGQFSYRCENQSTDWKDMMKVDYWSTGSLRGLTSSNLLTLDTQEIGLGNDDVWITQLPDDFVNVGVAQNSYVEMSIVLTASEHFNRQGQLTNLPPLVKSFDVCLEHGDSLSATVGNSLYNFSIVKGGVECIDSNFVADLNAVFSKFKIDVKLTAGVHCTQEEETYTDPPNIATEVISEGGMEELGIDQTTLYGILGAFLLIGMFIFIRSGVKGGSEGE